MDKLLHLDGKHKIVHEEALEGHDGKLSTKGLLGGSVPKAKDLKEHHEY